MEREGDRSKSGEVPPKAAAGHDLQNRTTSFLERLNVTIDSASQETVEGSALAASLTVNDINKSLTWYQNAGFIVDQKYDRDGKLVAASLKAGEARIVIGQDDGAKGWDRKKGEGCSLQITTKQNINDLANRVKARGVSLAAEPSDTPWGTRVFRLKDPDGFTFVISSER